MKVKVRVPATTANLGSGFDVFGAALSLYNEFEVEYVPDSKKTSFTLKGEGNKFLANPETGYSHSCLERNEQSIRYLSDPITCFLGKEKNLLWRSMQKTFEELGEDKYSLENLSIVDDVCIPLSGGLGSSGSAIVGGIVLANALCENKLNKAQIVDLAVKIEGHPDNVIPAVYGGICICSKSGDHWTAVQLPIPKLKVVLCVPTFEIRTKRVRKILPKSVNLQDLVFNTSRVALLTAAFCRSDFTLLKAGMEDKVHQPYRRKMIPYMDDVLDAALSAGAYGACLSGSGPALAAFCDIKDSINVQKNMIKRWKKDNVEAKTYELDFDVKGATIM